jgi:LPS export ABC transporter protein LptC
MKKYLNIRNILALLIVLGTGSLIVTVHRNQDRLSPGALLETVAPEADLALQRIHYTETRDGVRRWTLEADSAKHDVGAGVTRIENIRVAFHPENGSGTDMTMTARQGTVRIEQGELSVQGNVVVHSPEGYTVQTESLQYRETERQIRTQDPVRLLSEGMEMTGKGMILDIQAQTFVLLAEVQAKLDGQMVGRQP